MFSLLAQRNQGHFEFWRHQLKASFLQYRVRKRCCLISSSIGYQKTDWNYVWLLIMCSRDVSIRPRCWAIRCLNTQEVCIGLWICSMVFIDLRQLISLCLSACHRVLSWTVTALDITSPNRIVCIFSSRLNKLWANSRLRGSCAARQFSLNP